jgi:hypothetical protein
MPLPVELHPHARERASERGVTELEIVATVSEGERRSAKHNRTAFRRNFAFQGLWCGKRYATKHEAIAVEEPGRFLVITVIAKYF